MKASGAKQAIIWTDATPGREAAIISKFQALKAEWSRQQKDSAPPLIASNQDDIQACIQRQAAAGPRWPHLPIRRAAAAPTGRNTPEPSAAEAASASGQDGEFKLTARKAVGAKILRSGASLQRVAASVIPASKPPPTFVSWAYLKLNEQAQDHGKRMFYTDPDTGETVPDSDDDSGDNMPWEARTGSCIDHALMGVAREFGQSDAVLSALAEHLETTPKAVAARLQALLSVAPADQERDGQEVDDVLDAFFGVFCRRCRIFNCRLHGGGHVRPHDKPSVPAPAPVTAEPCGPECWRLDSTCRNLMSAAEQQQRDDDAARAAKRATAAAGDDSDMEVGSDDGADDGPEAEAGAEAEAAAGPSVGPAAADPSKKAEAADPGGAAQWSLWEESMLVRAQMVFGTDTCAISRLVGSRSCREVASRLALLRSMGQAIGQASARGLRGRKIGNRKPRKAQFAVNKKNVSGVFKKRLRHRENELWPEYVPCNCVGSCSAEYCSCHKDKNFCEKYCACSTRCSNRFRGCACRGQCRTRACPCLAAGRECDPDLCRGCAATCEGTAAAGSECLNMRLRMRQHLRIFMGKSTVHGWGAFLQGSCSEDDFLGEYTGDLITQEEADRRGRIYDRMNNSYLFNLNEQWVLDARHRGNKFRFANHSPKPNCKVRLLMVDGDWRVAVYANRNIRPNEELFYDYRYDQDVRPDWANKKK